MILKIYEEDSFTSINIEFASNSDPREDIFKYAVKKNWIILEMVTSKQNLEDIFRKLTGSNKIVMMKNTITIFKRELKSFFDSPMAYVF